MIHRMCVAAALAGCGGGVFPSMSAAEPAGTSVMQRPRALASCPTARGRHSRPFLLSLKGKPWFVNFLIVNFIIGVATAIGGMCLIVPGVYIAVRVSLAPYLVVDRNMGPIEALKT